MKKVLLVLAVVLGLSSIVQAKETLRVLFLFDSTYAKYGYYDRRDISKNLTKQLNRSFKESGLSGYISFTKVGAIPANVSISGYLNNSDKLTRFYKNANSIKTRKATLPLHKFQKSYKADLVVSITKMTDTCGVGTYLPNKGTFSSRKKSFEFADGGQVFINNASNCFNKKTLLAHEVGHTFGLWHGKAVKNKTGESGHYEPKKAFTGYANGFGDTDYWMNYGTIMAGSYLAGPGKGRDNKFSNPNVNTCGYYKDDEKCGDSTANAVRFIKENARYYNMRGDWYK